MGGNERGTTNVYKPLFSCGALLPEADDHQEVVVDLALAKHVTQTDGAAEFCGLDGDWQMMKLLWHCLVAVVVRRDIPFLHVGARVAVEEVVSNPFLETKTVRLDFGHMVDL